MVDLAEERQQLEEANTKHQQNLDNQVAGTTINTDNTLVLELAKGKNRTLGSSPLSPIIRVDGTGTVEQVNARYSFISMYAVEDIMYTVDEIFPNTT